MTHFKEIPKNDHITREKYLNMADYAFCEGAYESPKYHSYFLDKVSQSIVKKSCTVSDTNEIIAASTKENITRLLFSQIKQNKNNVYKIIAPFTDICVNEDFAKQLPENAILFATNVDVKHPNIYSIPIGRDPEIGSLSDFSLTEATKKNLVYSNFAKKYHNLWFKNPGKLMYHPLRKSIFDLFKKYDWATTIDVEQWNHYQMTGEEFLKQLASHEFCLAPEGNGIDTFRTWDSLYSGVIPIVKRSQHMDAFRDLPILFTEDYREITKSYLEEKLIEIRNREHSWNLLKFSYWKRFIINTQLR